MNLKDEGVLLAHLSAALSSPVGITLELLSEADVRLFRSKLYVLRKDHPEFAILSFKQVGVHLHILKRGEALYDQPF